MTALRIDELAMPRAGGAFVLPPELEAHEPPEWRGRARDDVRLLVTRGAHGMAAHVRFADLIDHIDAGDAIVLNTSATVPSRIEARAADGQRFRLHVSTRQAFGGCVVEPRERSVVAGEAVTLDGGAVLRIIGRHHDSRRLWRARVEPHVDLVEYLYRFGKPIAYAHSSGEWPIEAYQNVYAREAGSAEMPSAGRPFTLPLLGRLRQKGVVIAELTLHAGVSSPEREEPPYEEWFEVDRAAADAVNEVRARGGRVVATGTTVVRALESAATEHGIVTPSSGWTDLVISGEHRVRVVDGMITGFHEPRSTHLAMLEALAGREHVARAYREALAGGYLWHEFGDSHMILKR